MKPELGTNPTFETCRKMQNIAKGASNVHRQQKMAQAGGGVAEANTSTLNMGTSSPRLAEHSPKRLQKQQICAQLCPPSALAAIMGIHRNCTKMHELAKTDENIARCIQGCRNYESSQMQNMLKSSTHGQCPCGSSSGGLHTASNLSTHPGEIFFFMDQLRAQESGSQGHSHFKIPVDSVFHPGLPKTLLA